MPRKDATTGQISAQAQQDLVSEGIENFELPKSVVTKIAKSAIPENAKLQKETVLSLVKGSTVFINYLAATAHDVALSKQHKSISASDVLKALELIEFGDFVEPLQNELQVYRELAKTDKSKKGSANVNATATTATTAAAATTTSTSNNNNAQASSSSSASAPVPNAKKSGSGPGPGPITAPHQQQQPQAPVSSKPSLKARIKNLKGAANVAVSSASASLAPTARVEGEGEDEDNDVDMSMGESALVVSSALRVLQGGGKDEYLGEGTGHADHHHHGQLIEEDEQNESGDEEEEGEGGEEELVDMMQVEEEQVRREERDED